MLTTCQGQDDAVIAGERPRDHCGLFGVFGHPDAALLTYYGLYALQHRGQESAGIVASEGDGEPLRRHTGMGLVSQVFDDAILRTLKGSRAIGHVRYSTTGSSSPKNAQPILVDCSRGQIAIAHNGNLVNANILRDELEAYGSIFQTTVDSEIILHLMAQPRHGDRENTLLHALGRIRGAYSLVIMGENEIIGVRDPQGFRPLSIGMLNGAYILSSETCAFDLIHAKFVRDVDPAEVVIISKNGLRSVKMEHPEARKALCIFEYVYFARPDSSLEGRTVAHVRMELGRLLAREHRVDADVVVPVPDSGNYCALGYSEESKIPIAFAFVRNHYIGRTFLQPTQLIRDFNVRVKLNLIQTAVAGKRVVVVDDSIVRGTTARARVINLREAGAREVHVRVSCPPHRHPCHYGIDFPTSKELIASSHSMEEIKTYLGADSIGYLSLDGMVRATGHPPSRFCTACYTGDYPVPFESDLDKFIMEKRRTQRPALTADVVEDPQQRLL
ncbi:MAG: amidophosphoribosyltransferase [Verrucomicrobia bacterium]|nr:amidophosphoribosyltransferase [Verrucomicrobiota bacterium]